MQGPQHATHGTHPLVVWQGPVGRSLARPHRAELVDREDDVSFPDALLMEEQRTAVAGEIDERHDGDGDGQHRQADEGESDVEKSLHAGINRAVELVDVEQQGDPLELGDRELAEPLVVEQRQRADPHPMGVDAGRLGDHVVQRLRLPVQHDERDPVAGDEVLERRRVIGCRGDLGWLCREHEQRVLLGPNSDVS